MPRVALTFDDGPGDWTEPILDVLATHEARATFFVIGSIAQQRANVLRRIADAGHEIGNHTWSHPRLARDCDDERVHDELERTNVLLAELLGAPPRRFRAPRYDVDGRVIAIARRLGLEHTPSHVTPPDWDRRFKSGFIATLVLQQVRPGTIVGLHDGLPPRKTASEASRQATVEALATIVPRLRQRGFECVTVATLLSGGGGA
jgi:peptidoglycan/xylan/chitin deacetylase (PgdA/CDA1 family)